MKILAIEDQPRAALQLVAALRHFSHGVCPDCYERVIAPQLEQLRAETPAAKE